MNNEQIKKIALDNGFKLKEQPDGSIDLNPYVYEFSRKLMVEAAREAKSFLIGNGFSYGAPYMLDNLIEELERGEA